MKRKKRGGIKLSARVDSTQQANTYPLTTVSFPPVNGIYETPNRLYSAPSESPYSEISHYQAMTPYSKLVYSQAVRAEDIILDKTLGEGQFGVVRLGKIRYSSIPDHCKDMITDPTAPASSTYLVCAVKLLKENADAKSKRDFIEESQMMSNFNHPNVVRVITVLMSQSTYMLVTEYIKFGDLKGILKKSSMQNLTWRDKEFLFVLKQIAQGMNYLESIRFIHRDLAARNCLIHDNLVVKISDFGLSKELVSEKDYYRLQTKGKLPIKVSITK